MSAYMNDRIWLENFNAWLEEIQDTTTKTEMSFEDVKPAKSLSKPLHRKRKHNK